MKNKKSKFYSIDFPWPVKWMAKNMLALGKKEESKQGNRLYRIVDEVVNDRLLFLLILVDEEGNRFHTIEEAVSVPFENSLIYYREDCLFKIDQVIYTRSTSVVYLHGKRNQEYLQENKKYLL